jgi:hypothetical protein
MCLRRRGSDEPHLLQKNPELPSLAAPDLLKEG